MELEVQKYLRNSCLSKLTSEYGIKVKEYEHVVCLNYDQIKSINTDPITIECRALKLYKDGNWTVASRAFDRFFNYGEAEAVVKMFCFDSSVVAEKVDGSLIPVWFDKIDKKWRISTRGTAFGEHGRNEDGKSFHEIVLETFPELLKIMETEDPDFTFLFEFISPENRIVTPYEESQLVLLGIRHNLLGNYRTILEMEEFVKKCESKSVRMCKLYNFESLDKVVEFTSSFKRLEEGFVCWNLQSGVRIKIKSSQYVAIHLMRGKEFDEECILSVVLQGETDEFVSYYPDLVEKFRDAHNKISLFKENLSNGYAEICHLPEKEYALAVLNNNEKKEYSRLFFDARKTGNVTLSFDKLDIKVKIEFIRSYFP